MQYTRMIASCGMNCSICSGHLREKRKCPGCNSIDMEKPEYCRKCKIRACKKKEKFCYECDDFPCARLRNLDKRYRTKYDMSMIINLDNIRKSGIRKFSQTEKVRWRCSCGGTINVHKKRCSVCDKNKEK